MYLNLNSKLLPGTQKVNKQKIRCKNWGFVLVVRWAERDKYISLKNHTSHKSKA